jgi:hypothetical protein
MAVELADEVLAARSPRRPAWIRAHDENPRSLTTLVASEREEVRTFPDPGGGPGRAEVGKVLPSLQVPGRVEAHLPLERPRDRHHEALRRFVPEDLRVAKVPLADVEDGIRGKSAPGPAAVAREREMLALHARAGVVCRVDRDERRRALASETTRIVTIDDGASGEGHHAVPFCKRER